MKLEFKGTILLVDDEAELIQELKWQLEVRGYVVYTAESGDKALDIIKDKELDVMLVDIRMPGMNGIELMRQAIRIQPYLQCVVITGYADIDTAVEAMRIGAVNFLCKPKQVVVSVLDVSIREAIQKLELIRKVDEEQKMLKDTNEKLKKANEELEKTKEQLKNLLIERTEELKEIKIRELLVVLMNLSLQYYEMTTQKSKIDLAEESGIWAVRPEVNGPVAKTMNRYFKIDMIPKKRPNYQAVQKTALFVLARDKEKKYPDLRRRLEDRLKNLENILIDTAQL